MHLCHRAQLRAKPSHLDAKARAMRFVRPSGAESPRDQRVACHIARPRFAQRAYEREQHRSARQRDDGAGVTDDVPACVHDERIRCQQLLDVLEQKLLLAAAYNPPCRRRLQ